MEDDQNLIFEKMPHELLKPAPPFLFVDRVDSFDGAVLICRKQVGYNEPYLAGHFPGNPVVPGVLLIEMANQAGALLAIARLGATFSEGYLARTGNFTFYNFARPGDCLAIRMEYKEQAGNFFTARALITFHGEKKKAARGEVILYLR